MFYSITQTNCKTYSVPVEKIRETENNIEYNYHG